MKEINLIINEEQIKARPGMKVLEAALHSGIDIPHACYVPNIDPPVEECKLCVVEIEGSIMTACTTPVTEGMVVTTNTPELESLRRKRLHFPG